MPVNDMKQSAPSKVHSTELLTDQTNFLPFKKIVTCYLGLATCIIVSTLDSVIVATALPTISAAFHAGSIVSLVPSIYLLTSTCFQPLYGRFSDIFGRKNTLMAAMMVFMMGNLLAGFSKTIIQLVIFRGIAGAGGGGIFNMCVIVVSDVIPLRDRGKYSGLIGAFVALGNCIGPVIGGVLAEKVSWRWCFWISVPISVPALLAVQLVVPLKPVTSDFRKKLLAIDFIGSILALLACTLLVLPLIWGGITFPWSSVIVLAPLCASVIVIVVFCLWEWKGAQLPIVPMHIFKNITVISVYITTFINGYIQFSIIYYLPQYFQVVLGYSPIHAGVFIIPSLVSMITITFVSGIIVNRTGRYRAVIYTGFSLLSVGCGLISTVTSKTHKVVLVIFMLLAGCGVGQTLQTSLIAAQASIDRRDMAVVTGFRSFLRLFGGTVTLAIGSSIINNSVRRTLHNLGLSSSLTNAIIRNPSLLASPSALGIPLSTVDIILAKGYNEGFKMTFILNAVLAAVAAIVSITMTKHHDFKKKDDERLKRQAIELDAANKIALSSLPSTFSVNVKLPDIEAADDLNQDLKG